MEYTNTGKKSDLPIVEIDMLRSIVVINGEMTIQ